MLFVAVHETPVHLATMHDVVQTSNRIVCTAVGPGYADHSSDNQATDVSRRLNPRARA
jgi:hypothetical protein